VKLTFERVEPLAKWFANRLAELVRGEPKPMRAFSWYQYPSRRRLRERAYSQADLLGKALARQLGWALSRALLTAPALVQTSIS
jgi:predicted amidophosphoribosyltransferase